MKPSGKYFNYEAHIILDIFSCEDAAQQVLMSSVRLSVCVCVCGQPENLPYYILLQHPGCSRMFQNVPECSKMFQDVPGCSGMFKDVQGCSRMFKDVCLSVPQVENSVCVHSFGMHKDGTLQSYTYK